MRTRAVLLPTTIALALVGCGPGSGGENTGPIQGGTTSEPGSDNSAQPAALRWDLQSSGEGIALVLVSGGGRTVVRLFCPAGRHRLLVNVPDFRAVGSEERMTFGSGGEAAVLVADSRGDSERGGVSGTGPVPDNLAALVGGPVGVNYGAQDSGPHPPPAAQQARAFAAACSEAPPAEPGPPPSEDLPESPPDGQAAGACRMQDGKVIPPNLIKGVGTEPFWAARIEGRCVTYMTPEDENGTRIWTQFTGSREQGVWTGFYANQRFVLRTRPRPGCSDGMSDKRYPIEVELLVAGERRSGCAEPL